MSIWTRTNCHKFGHALARMKRQREWYGRNYGAIFTPPEAEKQSQN